MGDLRKTNTHELGEVIDMVKDLEEALYYCTIVEAMEDKEKQWEENSPIVNYYSSSMPYYDPYRDMDRAYGRSYYNGNMNNNSSSNSRN